MTDHERFCPHYLKFVIRNYVMHFDVIRGVSGIYDTTLGASLSAKATKNV
jgi:hypothetical protein